MSNNLSVIIATYNRNKVLCDTIDFLLNQTHKNFEILIIDQSKEHDDYTKDYLNHHKEQFQYHRLDKANLPYARNFGIKKATGNIILFLDDDVKVSEDFIARLLYIYSKHPEINGLTGLSISKDMEDSEKWGIIPRKIRETAKQGAEDAIWQINYLPGFFMSFSRNALWAVGGFDEWIGTQPKAAFEDGELCLRLRLNGYKLFTTPYLFLVHLVETSGGCEVRLNYSDNVAETRYAQYKMSVYGTLKNKDKMSLYLYLKTVLMTFYAYWATNNLKIALMPKLLMRYITMFREITALNIKTTKYL